MSQIYSFNRVGICSRSFAMEKQDAVPNQQKHSGEEPSLLLLYRHTMAQLGLWVMAALNRNSRLTYYMTCSDVKKCIHQLNCIIKYKERNKVGLKSGKHWICRRAASWHFCKPVQCDGESVDGSRICIRLALWMKMHHLWVLLYLMDLEIHSAIHYWKFTHSCGLHCSRCVWERSNEYS